MSGSDLEFPEAPLSPSLPSDFLNPPSDSESHFELDGSTSPKFTASRPTDSPERKATKPPNSKPGAAARKEPLNPADERRCKECSQNLAKWVERARSKKHDGDRAHKDRKHRLACVLALDAVVCFMIGFDFEDRGEAIRQAAGASKPHARSWSTLIPYVAKLASLAESVDADLAGVYYQICAVVRLHVIYAQRRTVSPDESARGLYSALADFRRGLALLPLHIINSRYGLNEATGWSQTSVDAEKPNPAQNKATLPLHVNSSLAEAAAFALNVGRKWAEIEGIDYTWEAMKT